MTNKYSKLGSNVLWMTVGNFASKLLIFLLVPFYTKHLSTAEYGIADLITTTVSLATPFFSVMVAEAILRFTLSDKYEVRQVFTTCITFAVVGLVLLIAISPVLLLSQTLKDYLFLFIIYYASNVFANILQQFQKGLNHIKQYVVSGLINTFVMVFLNILFLKYYHFGIQGYLFAIILGHFATCVYILYREKLWQYVIPFNKVDRDLIKAVLIFAIPLIPNSLSWWISNSSDKYILTYFWGTAINGIYSISYKIPSLMATISTIFTSAWQISAVEGFGSEESRKFFSDIYDKYSALYCIIASFIILFIETLAKILFANDFFEAWPYASILIVAAMFQAMCGFLGSVYTTAMKTKMIFITTMIGAVANIILNIILIPRFASYGAAVATLLSYIVVWLIRLIDSRKLLKIYVRFSKDTICYAVLFLQIIVTCTKTACYHLICFVGLVVICLLNIRTIKAVTMSAKQLLIRFIKTKRV